VCGKGGLREDEIGSSFVPQLRGFGATGTLNVKTLNGACWAAVT